MGYKPKFNKAQLEWANKQTLSCRQAAKLLGVSYNTYKKYAKLYGVFEEQKNPSGVGIPG